MPLKSKAQRRKFAELLLKGEITEEAFERWNRETGSAELPERVGDLRKKRAKKTPRKKRAAKKKRATATAKPKRSTRAKRTTRPRAKTKRTTRAKKKRTTPKRR